MKNILMILFLLIFIVNGFSYAVDFNGTQWLKEKQNDRINYVKGYIEGANSASNFLPKECKYNKAVFTIHNTDYYVKQITTFYQKYPYNKKILVKQVLLQMCDFLDMNVDEIAKTFY